MKNAEIIKFLKEHGGLIFLVVLLLFFGVYHNDVFFAMLLVYILTIKFFLSDFLKKKTKKYIAIFIWIIAVFIFISGYYVNHYFPHGEIIDLTEYGCEPNHAEYEDCYQEDMRNLQIPEWAIFLKEYGVGMLMALVFAGLTLIDRESSDA